jgi:4-hydroxybenzoate polyprenyltransferase
MVDARRAWEDMLPPALIALAIFSLISSACYVVNDIVDVERDRLHPRKRNRPLPRGEVSVPQAWMFAALLALGAAALHALLPAAIVPWVAAYAALFALNVTLYSYWLKNLAIADVSSLSLGFVLRVLGGCAAVGIAPTTWLLNCTLFLAMFLAFGKRLGERQAMERAGIEAAGVRRVHASYSLELLRMAVVVTAVATLLSYAGYVTDRAPDIVGRGTEIAARGGGETSVAAAQGAPGSPANGGPASLNWLWLTMLPATFGVLRAMVLLERGTYDDPTELATRDRAFQLSALAFAALTVAAFAAGR